MNMQNLMAQAQRMQRDIQKKQEEINKTEYESSNGAVNIKMNGKKEVLSVNIDKNIINDADDIEALEDMLTIAFNDTIKKIEKDTENKMGVYANGLNGLF